jgi:hypothetical protein
MVETMGKTRKVDVRERGIIRKSKKVRKWERYRTHVEKKQEKRLESWIFY